MRRMQRFFRAHLSWGNLSRADFDLFAAYIKDPLLAGEKKSLYIHAIILARE